MVGIDASDPPVADYCRSYFVPFCASHSFYVFRVLRMAFIAGCYFKTGPGDIAGIESCLRNFPLVSNDDLSSYENQLTRTRNAVLLRKYKLGYPIPPRQHTGDAANTLITLGFFTSEALPMNA